MGFFSVRIITHVVWSYATLGKYDQLLFDICADAAAKLVDSASPQVCAESLFRDEMPSPVGRVGRAEDACPADHLPVTGGTTGSHRKS